MCPDPCTHIHTHTTGTDNANIVVSSWVDLCRFLGSPEHPEECKLGLQPISESLNFLSSHFHELRSTSGQSVYSLINKEYVPVISQFINSLCVAMVTKWMEAISMGTAKSEEGTKRNNELLHEFEHCITSHIL